MASKNSKADENLLPSGSGPEASADVDLSDLRVNFSEKEASSEALDFTPVPTGKYDVAITGIETRFSTSEKNNGKPYWSVEMTVQEGKYADRKFWGNVMLFEGALYSLAQLLKATGNDKALETGKVPPADSLMGEQLTINVQKVRDTYREKQNGDGEVLFKNEVKGYLPLQGSVTTGADASGSLLP